MLLRRAAIRNDRLKTAAIGSRDLDDNSCSYDESLNSFGRFGNRPNESDHKLEAFLRKAAARTVDPLWAVVAAALASFSSDEDQNYLAHAGYRHSK
jgi:hypothetical protein